MKHLFLLVAAMFILTACHDDGYTFHWVTPEAVAVVEVVPEEEVGLVEPDPEIAPPCLVIKGNVSSSGEQIYHMPTGASYDQVKIDEGRGEAFFCTEQEALDAGFRKALR